MATTPEDRVKFMHESSEIVGRLNECIDLQKKLVSIVYQFKLRGETKLADEFLKLAGHITKRSKKYHEDLTARKVAVRSILSTDEEAPS